MFYNAFLLGSDCFKNIGVPTRTNLTTVVDNEISPPNECPPPVFVLVHTPNLGFPVVFIPKINSFMTVIW